MELTIMLAICSAATVTQQNNSPVSNLHVNKLLQPNILQRRTDLFSCAHLFFFLAFSPVIIESNSQEFTLWSHASFYVLPNQTQLVKFNEKTKTK